MPGKRITEDELDKVIVHLPPKPKVTQELMDWYENSGKELDFDLFDLFTDFSEGHYVPSVVYNWLTDGESVKNNQQRQYALATLLLYGPQAVEVEKEKRYKVKIKGTAQVFAKYGSSLLFELPNPYDKDGEKYSLTKQELIDAGFEGVFDNEMFEVEEVE